MFESLRIPRNTYAAPAVLPTSFNTGLHQYMVQITGIRNTNQLADISRMEIVTATSPVNALRRLRRSCRNFRKLVVSVRQYN